MPKIASLSAALLLLCSTPILVPIAALSSTSSSQAIKIQKTTIAVCTGPDCRVDGSSDCMRQLQKVVASDQETKKLVRVTGRPCIGPCGDGPCAFVTTRDQEKVVVAQPSKTQIALVAPDAFASNPKGWYQLRTAEQLNEVLTIACDAAGLANNADTSSFRDIAPSRKWYDRPRNERKVMHRLMQALVLLGFYDFEGELGTLQYCIGGSLFLLSDFIMKENLWSFLLQKFKSKKR